MPELPEIETIKTGLRETIFGKQILTTRVIRRDLRFPVPKNLEKTVRKLKILDVERRSKYLVLQLSKNLKKEDIVVVLFHDSGSRYIGKIYNDEWMKKNKFF